MPLVGVANLDDDDGDALAPLDIVLALGKSMVLAWA